MEKRKKGTKKKGTKKKTNKVKKKKKATVKAKKKADARAPSPATMAAHLLRPNRQPSILQRAGQAAGNLFREVLFLNKNTGVETVKPIEHAVPSSAVAPLLRMTALPTTIRRPRGSEEARMSFRGFKGASFRSQTLSGRSTRSDDDV